MSINPHSLLPVAYRAASRIVQTPVLAEEASERAVHQLTLAMLQGCMPAQPRAWLRVVARRSACALLRSEWARTRPMDLQEVANEPRAFSRAPATGQSDWVREELVAGLTPRQRDALTAAISCNSTRAAARCCGMQPRDFRRSLGSISRKARELLRQHPRWTADDGLPGCETGCPV